MVRMLTSIAALASVLFSVQVAAQASNNDPNGKYFYLSEPSCNYYECQVVHHQGATMNINWLNRLPGKVTITFEPQKSSGTTYTIASHLSASNNETTCDKGSQKTCGSYEWTIPDDVTPGSYSVQLHSLHNRKVYSYTDIVTIKAKTT